MRHLRNLSDAVGSVRGARLRPAQPKGRSVEEFEAPGVRERIEAYVAVGGADGDHAPHDTQAAAGRLPRPEAPISY